MSEAAQILEQTKANPAPVEAEKPVINQEPIQDPSRARALSALIARERSALTREQMAKKKESELQARMSDVEARAKKIEEFESARSNPKKALELLGLSQEDLIKILNNDGEMPPELQIRDVKNELDKLKAEQERKELEAKERLEAEQKSQLEKTVSTFKEEIKSFLNEKKDRYEFITFEGQEDLVYDVIEEHYNRTYNDETKKGEVLSKEDAADKVEKWLEEKYVKSKDLAKVKSLFGLSPKQVEEKLAPSKPETKPTQAVKTLTNTLSSTPQKAPVRLTDEERIKRAIAYAKSLRPNL